jgi:hypothetical protein
MSGRFSGTIQSFKEANGGSTVLLIVIGGLAMGLFGTGYGIVLNNISKETLEKLKKDIQTIFIVNFVLIFILMALSMIFIKGNPSMFQPYILVISHVTLLLALMSLSYSVLKVTN